jgi:hypothetical protein
MARKPPGHEHVWRIVSHTLAKPWRALLGCACSATMVAKPEPKPGQYEHLCCKPPKARAGDAAA